MRRHKWPQLATDLAGHILANGGQALVVADVAPVFVLIQAKVRSTTQQRGRAARYKGVLGRLAGLVAPSGDRLLHRSLAASDACRAGTRRNRGESQLGQRCTPAALSGRGTGSARSSSCATASSARASSTTS